MATGKSAKEEPSLTALSNELLLDIVDCLVQDDPNGYLTTPDRTPLKTLSCVNRHFRWLLRPRLMKSVVLIRPAHSSDQVCHWETTREAIGCLSKDVSLCNSMQKLRLEALHGLSKDFSLCNSMQKLSAETLHYLSLDDGGLDPETESVNDVAQFLYHLTNLEHLHMQAPAHWNHLFEWIFKSRFLSPPLRFDHVTTLKIEQSMVFLLQYCPRVQHLGLFASTGDSRLDKLNMPHYATFASHVSHLEAVAHWSAAEIEALAQAWPNLQHLGVFSCDDSQFPQLIDLLRGMKRCFKNLKVLKIAELYAESFWAGGTFRLTNLFQNTDTVRVQERRDPYDVPWDTFLSEHAGGKMMKELMEEAFCVLKDLEECRIGEMEGARRVWGDEPANYEEVWIHADGGDRDGDQWTLKFDWLEDIELVQPVKGTHGGGWLLRPA